MALTKLFQELDQYINSAQEKLDINLNLSEKEKKINFGEAKLLFEQIEDDMDKIKLEIGQNDRVVLDKYESKYESLKKLAL